jgi:hypothetical protein
LIAQQLPSRQLRYCAYIFLFFTLQIKNICFVFNMLTLENLARYIVLASFSQERMSYLEEEAQVLYRSKDGKEDKVLDALEWLAAMCSHVVPRKKSILICGVRQLPILCTHVHVYGLNSVDQPLPRPQGYTHLSVSH